MNARHFLFSLTLYIVVVCPSIAEDAGFFESWEQLPLGFVEIDENGLFLGDAGTWIAGDTVSEFPECGPTPHTGRIVRVSGEQGLRLTSNNSNSECADNVWVAIQKFAPLNLNPDFPIPIDENTVLSFEESGSLVDPEPLRRPTCVNPPCGDYISLKIEDSRGFVLAYVLQRAEGSEEAHSIERIYQEILLNPEAGSYSRNLLEDFSSITGYEPIGARVDSIIFEIDEHGSATIDNISIGKKCYDVAVAILRGGPHTLGTPTEPHNIALTNLETHAEAVGNNRVAARVFDADLRNPQIERVESWLDSLNADCPRNVSAILVGHSLGGDGAMRVRYDNICSRILLDAFDPDLLSTQCTDLLQGCRIAPSPTVCAAALLPVCAVFFDQSGESPRPPPPPNEGVLYSFLAERPKTFHGRPFAMASHVAQKCVQGTDHNSIVVEVVGTGAFQNTIVGREVTRCLSESPGPILGTDVRCHASFSTVLPSILQLLMD